LIQLVFQPRAVEAAGDKFIELKEKHGDINQHVKHGFHFIWLKDGQRWEGFKDDFKALINEIEEGWQLKRNPIRKPIKTRGDHLRNVGVY